MPHRCSLINGNISKHWCSRLKGGSAAGCVISLLVMMWGAGQVRAYGGVSNHLFRRQARAIACAAVAETVPTAQEEADRSVLKMESEAHPYSLFKRLGNPMYIAAPMVEHSEAVSTPLKGPSIYMLLCSVPSCICRRETDTIVTVTSPGPHMIVSSYSLCVSVLYLSSSLGGANY